MCSITVHLHISGQSTTDVTVRTDDAVSVLKEYIPGEQQKLIMYNGRLIMAAFSFSFFGIGANADLYVVQCPKQTKATERRHEKYRLQEQCLRKTNIRFSTTDLHAAKQTQTELVTNNKSNFVIDGSIIKELARLVDIYYSRIDMHKASHEEEEDPPLSLSLGIHSNQHNIIHSESNSINFIQKNSECQTSQICPSTVALPQFW